MTSELVSILAAAIAFLGICIAWGQWHTARQSLVLSLFDKRYNLYRSLQIEIGRLYGECKPIQMIEVDNLAIEAHTAFFLFGPDINTPLQNVISALKSVARQDSSPVSGMSSQSAAELDDIINGSLAEFDRAALEYMRMDQKLPITLWDAIRTRWVNRPDGTV